jgi:signal peptidase I
MTYRLPGELLLTGSALVAGLVILAAVLRHRWVVVTVHGPSMLPTFRDSDVLLVRRCDAAAVSVGQVVVVESPRYRPQATGAGPRVHRWLIKRLAAVAGDPVPAGVAGATDAVPAGALIVLGDSRGHDSMVFGPLPADHLLGVVVRRLGRRPTEQHERKLT